MSRYYFKYSSILAFVCITLLHYLSSVNAEVDNSQTPRTQTIAFRLDDVQDHWLSETQQAIIELFSEEDLKLTLGIVGSLVGNDEELIELIKSKSEILSIANHGLHAKDNNDGYSLLLTQPPEVTRQELSVADSTISKIFKLSPETYIPHQNEFNDTILTILKELGYSHISSSCSRHNGVDYCPDECSYDIRKPRCGTLDAYNLIHIPSGASTQWSPAVGKGMNPVNHVLEEIRSSIKKYCFAVVMMHPQDFATVDGILDSKQVKSLKTLLREIQSNPDSYEVVWLEQVEPRCP